MKKMTLFGVLIVLISSIPSLGLGGEGRSDKRDIEAGAVIFKKYCSRCHGPQGRGDGPASKILKTKPHDFTDAEYMAKMSDVELLQIIAGGGAAVGRSKLMPPYGKKLKEKELRAVVAYVRSLAGS